MLLKSKFRFIFLTFSFLICFLFLLEERFSFLFFSNYKNGETKFFINNEIKNSSYDGLFFLTDDVDFVNEDNVVGEVIILSKNKTNLTEIKQFFSAKLVFFENINTKIVYYLHSPLLQKEIKTKGETFNLQVIFSEDFVEIYYPINFGSF